MTNNIQDMFGVHLVRTGPHRAAVTVLLHPVGLDLTCWSGQIAVLAENHDLLAYDLPGHGLSPGTPADWTFDAAVLTLARIVRSTRGRAHIVGISIGSMIAQAFALAHPELVASLVLIGAAATFPDEVRQEMRGRAEAARQRGMPAVLQTTITRWFTPATILDRPDIVDRVTKSMLRVDPSIYGAMWDMIASLDFAHRLGEIACPTLIMTGVNDPICSPEVARGMQRKIKGSSLQLVAEAAHMCILEQPDEVNGHLQDFFSGLAS
jgi:3-oxoadipate enol-lactonase